MLRLAIPLFLAAATAGMLGFGNFYPAGRDAAQVLFVVCVLLFLLSLTLGRRKTPLGYLAEELPPQRPASSGRAARGPDRGGGKRPPFGGHRRLDFLLFVIGAVLVVVGGCAKFVAGDQLAILGLPGGDALPIGSMAAGGVLIVAGWLARYGGGLFRRRVPEKAGESALLVERVAPMLAVADLERSVAFYRDRLGFEVRERSEGLALLVLGPALFYLVAESAPTPDKPEVWLAPPDSPGRTPFNLVLRVSDCNGAYEALRQKGVEFLTAPQTPAGGGLRCFGRDPDGYLIEIEQPA